MFLRTALQGFWIELLQQACLYAGAKIGVLAKIESADSVGHLEEILDAVDGAMVARGDLGAELPVEEVCRGEFWWEVLVLTML